VAEQFCSACPVWLGLCPRCGTYWLPQGGGGDFKRYGVRPVESNALVAVGGDTRHPGWLGQWPNVVQTQKWDSTGREALRDLAPRLSAKE
jgi:hypothetical protein